MNPRVTTGTNAGNSVAGALARAVSLHLEGKSGEALCALNGAVELGGDEPEFHSARGYLQFELEAYEDAVTSYRRLLDLAPQHAKGSFHLAVCHEKLGRWDEAAAQFRSALALNPERIDARLGLGICELHQSRPEEALDSFDLYLAAKPGDRTALFGKAVALQFQERFEEAAELYLEILKRCPHAEDSLANLVAIGLAGKDTSLIQPHAQRLLELRPNSPVALEGLAACAFASGDYEAAVNLCTKLVTATPDNFGRWFNLGLAFQKLNQLEDAGHAYTEALRIRPDSRHALLNLGVVRQGLGDLGRSSEAYERVLQLDGAEPGGCSNPEVWLNLAAIREKLGPPAEAESLYERAVSQNPALQDAWFRLGCLRLERSDYAGAAEALENCVRLRPERPEARTNLAIAYWRGSRTSDARRVFEELLASVPEAVEAVRGLAALAIERGDDAQALEFQIRLIELGERSPELFYNTGLLLQKTGQFEDAIRLYHEALSERPGFTEALLNLGHALKAQGRTDEARSCWRDALAAGPELAQGLPELAPGNSGQT